MPDTDANRIELDIPVAHGWSAVRASYTDSSMSIYVAFNNAAHGEERTAVINNCDRFTETPPGLESGAACDALARSIRALVTHDKRMRGVLG